MEALTGTRLYLGYEDGTSETFDIVQTLAQAHALYDPIFSGALEREYIQITTPDGTIRWRKLWKIDEFTLSVVTLVDATKTRQRRRPAKKTTAKPATTARKGTTKRA